MALENEEELQRAMAELTKSMQGLGTDTAVADNELTKFSKSVSSVGSAMAGAAGQVMKGGGAFSSLNGAIDLATKALGSIVGAIPVIGGAAKEFANGVGEAAKFVMNQLDDLAKNYNALGESGALAADGIDGVQRQFKQMGLVSLPTFTKVINQSTVGMTAFGGSVAEGAEQFSKLAGSLTTGDIGAEFVKLGMSFDGVGESAGKYISTFSRLGLTQGKTFEELKKSTQDYILEVDQISRITGATRKQQEEEQQKNLANAKFRAMIFEMQNNGQEKQAAQMEQYVNGLTGPMADAARASLTGISTTKEAVELDMVLNGAMTRNIAALKNGASAQEALADINKSSLTGAKNYAGIMKYSGDIAGGAGAQLFDMAQMGKRQMEIQEATGMSAEAAAKQAQDELRNNQGATKEFATAQQKVAGASKDLQELSFNLVKNVVPAVDAFAGSIKRVTGFINEKFGGPTPTKPGTAPSAPASKQDLTNLLTGKPSAQATPSAPGAPVAVPADIAKYLKSTALIESGGNANARAGTSSAGGMFQFLDKTWAQTVKEMGKNYSAQDKFDPAKATEVMAFFTSKQKAQVEQGTGKEATNVDLYMAHFLGAGGATKFINAMAKNPAMSAAAMDPAAASANKSIYYDQGRERSLQEVYNLMGQKMAKAETAVETGKWGGKDIPATVAAITSQMQGTAGKTVPAGPTSGFQPQLANATPATTLPPAQQAQANNQAKTEDDKLATGFMALQANLEVIARNSQRQLAVQEKQLKQTS